MIKNYLKVALRSLIKQKAYSAINILGLSIGIASCLLIVLFVTDEFSYDKFNTKADRIYKMTLDGKVLGWIGKSGKQKGQFGWIHSMACPDANTLYVAELLNWRVQKLTLRP